MRRERIAAFCAWRASLPACADFQREPGFQQFFDLTDGEILSADAEVRRRRRGPAAAEGIATA